MCSNVSILLSIILIHLLPVINWLVALHMELLANQWSLLTIKSSQVFLANIQKIKKQRKLESF